MKIADPRITSSHTQMSSNETFPFSMMHTFYILYAIQSNCDASHLSLTISLLSYPNTLKKRHVNKIVVVCGVISDLSFIIVP